MQVKTTFFTGLDLIEIPATSRRGEIFADCYRITTDKSYIREIINPYTVHIGSVEQGYLTGGGAKAFPYRIEERELKGSDIPASLDALLVEDMLSIKSLQNKLWLIKDNAVHFDRCWIVASVQNQLVVNNNIWASRVSCADGAFRSIRFDNDELRAARSGQATLSQHLTSEVVEGLEEKGAIKRATMLTKGSLRFQRFSYFIDMARTSEDVALKIAQYCSGLEALVSNSQMELSHQVSERVAVVLAPAGDRRVTIFKLLKEAYGYRSKAVHGTYFKMADAEKLRRCSALLDQVCREIYLLYLDRNNEFSRAIEGDPEKAIDFFLSKTLGAHLDSIK